MDHPHQLLQRLRLELTHSGDALVQPRAGSRPKGFLEGKTKLLYFLQRFPASGGFSVTSEAAARVHLLPPG